MLELLDNPIKVENAQAKVAQVFVALSQKNNNTEVLLDFEIESYASARFSPK